jgi:hypothetical protein
MAETGGIKHYGTMRMKMPIGFALYYLSAGSQPGARNVCQKVPTTPAPFKMVCHHDGFSAAGDAVLFRHLESPATSVATADAMERMVLACSAST